MIIMCKKCRKMSRVKDGKNICEECEKTENEIVMTEYVRCKDCKYWGKFGTIVQDVSFHSCTHPDICLMLYYVRDVSTHQNFGCVLGEREPIEDDDELAERLR